MSDTVLKHYADGVLELTLNRPAKKNSFNREQWHAFTDAIAEARRDDDVAVVIVTGAGDDFSSGTDITEFLGADDSTPHPFAECAHTLSEFDKPLIGAARGIAIGGGATLLLHTDVLYVGDSLRMRLPFVNLAVVPEFGSSYLLGQRIGPRQAAELLFTARWIDAEKAVATGFATDRCADGEVLERARVTAAEIAQWPVRSLQATKRLMKQPHAAALHAALEAEEQAMLQMVGSPENIEAVTAIFEKRKPDFRRGTSE